MRKKQELIDAENERADKIWYNRHCCLAQRVKDGEKIDKQIWKDARKAARTVEKKYGKKNLMFDDYEWGQLNGELSALRWMLGEDWGMLDT